MAQVEIAGRQFRLLQKQTGIAGLTRRGAGNTRGARGTASPAGQKPPQYARCSWESPDTIEPA
ncbi:hypothetical protein J4732_04030 [Serratia marcescens]|uniref:Uncharacterized protein n=1 Tax=Serratia marcescens TaxID=615 RepID=A0A939NLI4_SERMA|nr:hypothetical protein [Serratia marcescens]